MPKPIPTYDGYLELHAQRAPLGGVDGRSYKLEAGEGNDWDMAMYAAAARFSGCFHTTVYLRGRSGRHVCIADNPDNRRRYWNLRRAALAAAKQFWLSMCEED